MLSPPLQQPRLRPILRAVRRRRSKRGLQKPVDWDVQRVDLGVYGVL